MTTLSENKMLVSSNIKDIYALSPMQEGMYFHALYDPASRAFFDQVSYRFTGDLNVSIAEKSINTLFQRHDVLRTVFNHKKAARPLQVVLKQGNCDFTYNDIRGIDPQEKEQYLKEFKEKDKHRSFNLNKDLMMRVTIFQLEDNAYEFVWSYHHILMDGWCVGILTQEYFEIYNAYKQDKQPVLLPPKPYSTYIKWLEKQDKEASSQYWGGYLDSYKALATVLNSGVSGKPDGTYDNRIEAFELGKERAVKLQELSVKTKVTLGVIFQTVWGIILSRYNATNDVVFGTMVSGRPTDIIGIESMVGLFTNLIPVRVRYKATDKFSELLYSVQEAAITGNGHHHHSLAEIQSAHPLKQNLFDHIVVFQNFPVEKQIEGLAVAGTENDQAELVLSGVEAFTQTNYDFNIRIQTGGASQIELLYNANVIPQHFIEDVRKHITGVIDQVLADSTREIGSISLTGDEPLVIGNKTSQEGHDQRITISTLFENQVAENPEGTAVVSDGVAYSYQHINEKSNQLAHYLRETYAVKADDLIGVVAEKSEQLVIALLGILKSGGAYLPVEPDCPKERMASIFTDAGAKLVITESEIMFGLFENYRGDCFALDIQLHELETSRLNPERINCASDLAYVIYTSGSTGTPKGVMIEHRSLINLCEWHKAFYQVTAESRATMYAEINFDASVWETFPYLLSGACLYPLSKNVKLNLDDLVSFYSDNRITHTFLPTPVAEMLIDTSAHNIPEGLKILVGGDKLRKVADTKLDIYNNYGPTESTVVTTAVRIKDLDNTDKIPIGLPIDNLMVYVVDEHMNPVPKGIKGELCIGGAGVARGYLNREELTRESFLDNPFGDEGKIYKSGDFVRVLPDGNIEFLGRQDDQVKIRGRRIELEEIEKSIQKQQDVQNALVLPIHKDGEVRDLVAYIVAETDMDTKALQASISRLLPDYMVPRYYITLNRFPITSNGKIDKKALPAPVLEETGKAGYVAPGNETEQELAKIWEEVLGVSPIGIKDNFFNLGGHSLKATQVMSKLLKYLDCKVELADIFTYPTIEELAVLIDGNTEEKYQPIPPLPQQELYEVSYAQKRIWLINQMEETLVSFNSPGAYVLKGALNIEVFNNAFNAVVERHEILRTTFVLQGDNVMQKIHAFDRYNFKIDFIDLSQNSGAWEEAAGIADKEAYHPFDLEKGPLLRAKLLKVDRDEFLFLLTMHHIISDGWSMEVIVSEVKELYDAFTAQKESPLSPLKIQYKDYAAWQNNLMKGGAFEKDKQYWLNRFNDGVVPLDLPVDYPRPQVRPNNANVIKVELDNELTKKLKGLSDTYDASLYMVVLALLNVLFYKYTRQNDIVIGSPIVNRDHPDLDGQVGLYLNTLAMRNTLKEDSPFSDFLTSVRTNTLEAYQHQPYPFDHLVTDLNIKRDFSRSPLFDIGFTWQNTQGLLNKDSGKLGDLKVEAYDQNFKQVKADFWVEGEEDDGLIKFVFSYLTDLYKKETVEGIISDLREIIRKVVQQPESDIKSILELAAKPDENITPMKNESKKKNLERFLKTKKKSVDIESKPLVSESFDPVAPDYPLVLKPVENNVLLADWIDKNQAYIKKKLLTYGGILFRDFHIHSSGSFQQIVQKLGKDQMEYVNRSSPRSMVDNKVYTSTDHPADQLINMHNELSYSHTWPMQILFFCLLPSEKGGETPIADSRKVLSHLDEKIISNFRKKGLLYVRNIVDGIGLSWREVYQTDDKQDVEQYCKTHNIDFEWISDQHLRQTWKRDAIRKHPVSGEEVWFNHGFFYNSHTIDDHMREAFKDISNLPFNTYYGDGSPIEIGAVNGLREAYEKSKVAFAWQKGDILLLDNMLMAHGRNPYEGDRKILVAMTDPVSSM